MQYSFSPHHHLPVLEPSILQSLLITLITIASYLPITSSKKNHLAPWISQHYPPESQVDHRQEGVNQRLRRQALGESVIAVDFPVIASAFFECSSFWATYCLRANLSPTF